MQHHHTRHTNAPRAPPQGTRGGARGRAAGGAGGGGHHMPMNPSSVLGTGGGPVPPPNLNLGPPPAQLTPQQKMYNSGNYAVQMAANSRAAYTRFGRNQQQQQQHHHHQQQQQHHHQKSSSQMPNIHHQHQQHQSIDIQIKANHHHHQYNRANNAQQQLMGATQQHMGALQQSQPQQQDATQPPQMQQRNIPTLHQQQPPPVVQQQQQQQPVLPTGTTPRQPQQQPQQRKSPPQPDRYKLNNPSNTKYTAPKTILQNPNRLLNKTRPSTATTQTPSPDEANVAPVVPSEKVVVPIESTSIAAEGAEGASASTPVAAAIPTDSALNTENALPSNTKDGDGLPSRINEILSNTDPTAPKNSKEKTPMCLVNELARFNKITHQYRLTGERGPAHFKCFTVTLKLGDEEYSAEGFKIKKAQHFAANEAMEKTKYKHPMQRNNKRNEVAGGCSRPNITPTVELNALAMKMCQPTFYLLDPRELALDSGAMPPSNVSLVSPPPPFGMPPPGHHMGIIDPMAAPPYLHRRNANMPRMIHHHQRFPRGGYPPSRFPPHGGFPMMPPPHHFPNPHYGPQCGPLPPPVKITLIVGKQKFNGTGRTMQQAKHDAAARALQVLKVQTATVIAEKDVIENVSIEGENKSPISLVHEVGIKRNLTVHFRVVREEGPAHMKNFVTACAVGSIITEGEGNGKKISKKRAAAKMVEELKKLPPLSPVKTPVKQNQLKPPASGTGATPRRNVSPGSAVATYERRRQQRQNTSIKEKPAATGAVVGGDDADADVENPITKLIQLAQIRKEKEPQFELIGKNGSDQIRRRDFIIEVASHGLVARGMGSSKKMAKRNAAQNLLIAMGVEPKSVPTADKASSDAAAEAQEDSVKKVAPTSSDADIAPAATTEAPVIAAADGAEAAPLNTSKTDPAATSTPAPSPARTHSTVNTPDNSWHKNLPLITTSAGQVPGILIVRQSKKHAAKKREIAAAAAASTTPALETKATETNKDEQPLLMSNTASSTSTATETIAAEVNDAALSVVAPSAVTPAITNPVAAAPAAVPKVTFAPDTPADAALATTTQRAAPPVAATHGAVCNAADVPAAAPPVAAIAAATLPAAALPAAPLPAAAVSAKTVQQVEPISLSEPCNSNSNDTASTSSASASAGNAHMKRQLMYLSGLLGFEVTFSDYPKGNHNDFLTIVTIGVNPTQICHGMGASTEESQNDASKNALKILAELGFGK